MKRVLLIFIVAFIMVHQVIAGGARQPDKQITITVLSAHGDHEAGMRGIIAEYEALNPNVKIEAIYNSQSYAAQFQSMLASGTLPDIFVALKQNLPDLAKSGIILDISNRPAADLLFDVALGPNSYDGKLYTVPFSLQGYGLLYNQDIFDAHGISGPPRTLLELEDTIKKLKAGNVTPFTTMVGQTWATGQYLLFGISPFLHADPSLISSINSGAESFNNTTFLQLFDFLSIMRDNQQENAISYGFGEGAAHFGSGNSAMTVHGDWILRTALEFNQDLNLKIAGIPYSNNADDPIVVVGTSDGYGVNANSKNLDQVLDFFDYLTSLQSAQTVSTSGVAPFRGFDVSTKHPLYQNILEAIAGGQSIGWEWVKLNPITVSAADNAMQGYMNRNSTAEQVLLTIEDAIDLSR